jgi:catechol 2,3-dioxygenase-like lactoylglutathione lyase family enzyme
MSPAVIELVVSDMAAILAFYRRVGLDVPSESDDQPHAEAELEPGRGRRRVGELTSAGYEGHLAPWDAVWGMRYAVVRDPDGTPVDLFAPLPQS